MVAFLCIGLSITTFLATRIIMEYIFAVKEEREEDTDEADRKS